MSSFDIATAIACNAAKQYARDLAPQIAAAVET